MANASTKHALEDGAALARRMFDALARETGNTLGVTRPA
jgi:hypothetical protein